MSRSGRTLPAVLFDLDGTLIDSIELILNSARYAFERLGRVTPPDEEWLAGVGIPLFTMFGRYARDDADKAALIAAYREYQLEHHDRLVRCYDEVVDTVTALRARGHEIGIVTSKSEYLALRALALVGIAKCLARKDFRPPFPARRDGLITLRSSATTGSFPCIPVQTFRHLGPSNSLQGRSVPGVYGSRSGHHRSIRESCR